MLWKYRKASTWEHATFARFRMAYGSRGIPCENSIPVVVKQSFQIPWLPVGGWGTCAVNILLVTEVRTEWMTMAGGSHTYQWWFYHFAVEPALESNWTWQDTLLLLPRSSSALHWLSWQTHVDTNWESSIIASSFIFLQNATTRNWKQFWSNTTRSGRKLGSWKPLPPPTIYRAFHEVWQPSHEKVTEWRVIPAKQIMTKAVKQKRETGAHRAKNVIAYGIFRSQTDADETFM